MIYGTLRSAKTASATATTIWEVKLNEKKSSQYNKVLKGNKNKDEGKEVQSKEKTTRNYGDTKISG